MNRILLLTIDDYFITHLLDGFINSLEADEFFLKPHFKIVGGKTVKEYTKGHYTIYKDASGKIWFDSGFDISGMVDDITSAQKFYE